MGNSKADLSKDATGTGADEPREVTGTVRKDTIPDAHEPGAPADPAETEPGTGVGSIRKDTIPDARIAANALLDRLVPSDGRAQPPRAMVKQASSSAGGGFVAYAGEAKPPVRGTKTADPIDRVVVLQELGELARAAGELPADSADSSLGSLGSLGSTAVWARGRRARAIAIAVAVVLSALGVAVLLHLTSGPAARPTPSPSAVAATPDPTVAPTPAPTASAPPGPSATASGLAPSPSPVRSVPPAMATTPSVRPSASAERAPPLPSTGSGRPRGGERRDGIDHGPIPF